MKKFKKPERPERKVKRGRVVVGIHAVHELLKVRPASVDELWLRQNYQEHSELKRLHDQAKARSLKVTLHPPAELDRIVSHHQGILAFSREQPEADWDEIETAPRAALLALDEVEDPHNLGAVLRTCWLLGVKAVLTPAHRSADLSPAVSKVAQGAVEHVAIERENALENRLKQLKESGFWILGLSHKAKQSLFDFEIPEKVVWVLGSESSGLRRSTEGACDDLISIPQSAPEASFNVSVAAAITLAETYRQHRRA